jgi:uncharacterized protein (UPF0332 family)
MKEITDLVSKAGRFLKTAEAALGMGDYDSCASRCYYAMFFLAEAALLTIGTEGFLPQGGHQPIRRAFREVGDFWSGIREDVERGL